MSTISFVIPVYRNRGSLRATYDQVAGLMRGQFPALDYEFVFVDDGSDDGSLGEILALREADPRVKALALSRNFGQLQATIAGLRQARGDACVIMSADLQDPVQLIGEMIREWQAGNRIVIGYRVAREDGLAARLTSRLFYGLVHLSNPDMPTGGFDFVLMDREPYRIFAALRDRNRFFQGDVLWLGFPTKFLPYERLRRPVGKSQWTVSKKVKYFIDGILDSSYLPIRAMSVIGTLTALAGFGYALVVVVLRLTNRVPYIGYAPIMVSLLVIGGLIMTMLGVIGEYLWRIYDEARGRPLYIVKDRYLEAPEVAAAPESDGAELLRR
jgi:dolichol-phosphate mannosyltransferase